MTVRTARRVAVPVAVVVAVALALGAVVFTSLRVGRSAWVVPSAYSVSADGRTLTLHVWGGADTVLARADVTSQDDDAVVVAVLERHEPGSYPAIAFVQTIDVALREPLGDREVRDRSGAAIPLLTGDVPHPGA